MVSGDACHATGGLTTDGHTPSRRRKYDPSLPLAFKIARLFELPIEEIFDPGDGGGKPSR